MGKIKLLDEIETEIPEDDEDDIWEDEEVEEICPIKKNKKRSKYGE